MKKMTRQILKADELRHKAELRKRQLTPPEVLPLTEVDTLRLVHELQVHQIELEIQNEELLQSRSELENGLDRYTELYDLAPVGYFTLSREGMIRQANLFAARLLQVARANLMGMHFEQFIHKDKRPVFKSYLEDVFTNKTKETCEVELATPDDKPGWIQIEAIANESQDECRGVVFDITARKQAEIELHHLSMHDILTGLYNRAYFYETMQRLEHSRHFPISILMADVDHLKSINDNFGHAAGDTMLVRVAQVLSFAFRAEDIVARIGGDEFAIILPETNAATSALILQRFNHILQEHNLLHPDQPLHLTFGQFTAENKIPLAQMLIKADADLYREKRKRVFPEGERQHTESQKSAELRRMAEDLFNQKASQANKPQTQVDLLRLVHELEVHQIELALQNEELQRSRSEVETTLERYTDLYDFAPVGYYSLGQDGTVFQANLTGARLLGMDRLHLIGARFGLFVREDYRSGFSSFLEKIFTSQVKETCEVALQKDGQDPLWVQIEGTVVGDGQICRAVVLDINTRIHTQDKLKIAQVELERLLRESNLSREELLRVVEDKKQTEERIRQLNAELEQRVSERTAELSSAIASLKQSEVMNQTLFRVSKKLNSTLDLDTILDDLAQEAIRIVNGESGFAGLRTPEGLSIRKYFHRGGMTPFEYTWPAGKGIPGWVLKYKVPYGTSDAAHDPAFQPDLAINYDVHSIICTPILDSASEVIGYFDIRNKKDGEGFSISDQEMLMALAPVASIAIQNAQAYQQRVLAEIELKKSFENIRALAANLESVREEERTQIARELHDQLGQALTAMKFDLAWMTDQLRQNDPGLVQKSRNVTKQMDTMIKTVRRIATELRPGMLDDLGLAASIEWQAGDFEKRTGIVCDVSVPAEELPLTRAQAVAMFRIFQESLTNISRHAKAQHIEVKLTATAEVLTLQIHDDGRGIQADEIIGIHSLGLLGMRERAKRLGGNFDIQGLPGNGTLVTASFPINK